MTRNSIPFVLSGILLLVGVYGAWTWYRVEQYEQQRESGGIVAPVQGPPLQEFELTERSGQPFRSRDMRGKVWVAMFFFSTCPGSCTRLNSNIRYLNTLDELRDVTWVSITVDPENDTLEVLRKYADDHDADPQRWLFCRGDLSLVARIGKDVMRVGDVYYKGHKDYAVVIDRRGKWRGALDATSYSQSLQLTKLLKECLAEGAEDKSSDQSEPPDNSAKTSQDAA